MIEDIALDIFASQLASLHQKGDTGKVFDRQCREMLVDFLMDRKLEVAPLKEQVDNLEGELETYLDYAKNNHCD